MPRLPDTYGVRPIPDGGRPMASIDGTATGRAMADLGQAVFGLGAAVARRERQKEDEAADFEVEVARSNLLRGSIEVEREVQEAPDYATWEPAYTQRLTALTQEASKGITDERRRQRFELSAGDFLAKGRDRLLAQAKRREVDGGRASLSQVIDNNIETALGMESPEERDALLLNAGRAVDAALARGYVTEQEAVAMRRNIATDFAKRRLGMLPPEQRARALGRGQAGRIGPEIGAAIDAAATGEDAAILRRIALLESAGNPGAVNPTSGAAGLFQFMPATAGQYGLTDPMDAGASAKAAASLLADNRASLTRALGREPTGWELYLAHQQGAGGAAALLRAPDENAITALAAAYGGNRDRAAAAIRQNGGNDRMTAGAFAALWQRRFNAATAADVPAASPDAGLARFLPPDDVERIASAAERDIEVENRQRQQEWLRGFGDFVDATRAGATIDPGVAAMYSDAVLNAVVPDEAQRKLLRETRDDAVLSADLSRQVRGASPEKINELAGALGQRVDGTVYEASGLALAPSRAQMAAAFGRAVSEDFAARQRDPAKYALEAVPFIGAMAERAGERPGSTEAYAEATLAEQARLGVPERQRRVLTKAQAEELAAKINDMPASEVGAAYIDLQSQYGAHAGLVRSQLEDAGVSPEKHIAGLYAGQPATSQAIAAVAGMKREDLTAGIDPTVPNDVRIRLATEMDEFRGAFLAGDFSGAAQRQFSALFGIAEKMALSDFRMTGDVADAVERTVKKLITDVYEVVDTSDVRAFIPRTLGGRVVDVAAIEDRAEQMKTARALVAFGPVPFGEATQEPASIRNSRTIQAAMNGVWITNSAGDGLVLVMDMGDGTTLPVVNDRGQPYGFRFLE